MGCREGPEEGAGGRRNSGDSGTVHYRAFAVCGDERKADYFYQYTGAGYDVEGTADPFGGELKRECSSERV